jgi:hypothetical protein
MTKPPISRIALLGLVIGIGALAAVMLAGIGTRADLWDFRTGFGILRPAAWTGLGAVAIGIIGLVIALRATRRGIAFAMVGIAAGALAYGVPATGLKKARFLPKIHDISTDTANPPLFVAALEARKKAKAKNSTDYAGEKIAELQRKAYPDIVTLKRTELAEQLFEKALATAKSEGWEILSADKAKGRIEAIDTTFWFGFKDDIVIRIASDGATGSLLDIRSVSRVGRSDAGANAARIRRFIVALKAP